MVFLDQGADRVRGLNRDEDLVWLKLKLKLRLEARG